MERPIERRGFVGLSLGALASSIGAALVLPGRAAAQPRRGRGSLRPDWTAEGPPDGREPSDPTAPSEEERIHVPTLSVPAAIRAGRPFDLVVQIGFTAHPMQPDHRIDWVEVRIGETRAWVIDLGPGVPFPVVRVPVVLEQAAPITVRARCSQHGVWRTRHSVTF